MVETHLTATDKSTLQDLILFRVHEILLVASPYDHFVLEEDGRLTEQILHEYLGMNLSNAPRVWRASSAGEALKMITKRKYDLVIVMIRILDMDPLDFASKIKTLYPRKPVIILAFDESEIKHIPYQSPDSPIDKVFIWSGNANVFPAIIKYIEDMRNIKRDVKKGDVRGIIVIEDSPRYYSVILPLIYKIITYHMKNMVDMSLNDMERLLHRRGRPKILLTCTYEKAEKYYKKYRSNILGIISDIQFPRKGKDDPNAGFEFVRWVRSLDPYVPVMLQSKHEKNRELSKELKAHFLHKDSKTLLQDLGEFIVANFGLGAFIFRMPDGKEIDKATDMDNLIRAIKTIPDECLIFHADSNHISNWIAARGEFQLASKVRPLQVVDFENVNALRQQLITLLQEAQDAKIAGHIVEFSANMYDPTKNFTRMASGSLGGKARGLAFANTILMKSGLVSKYPDINLRVPKVTVIGTNIFDQFMAENNLWKKAIRLTSNLSVLKLFLKAKLPNELKEPLQSFLKAAKYPLAIRSSSMLEDSQYQPLAGMYSTFMLPNSSMIETERFQQISEAIIRIYASMFFQEPKSMIEASIHRHEVEKMAIIIMELVGQRHNGRFYPTISGTARSFNYYPVSYMKREEGVAYVALGLGRTIVEGGKALRFSPKYPALLPQFFSIKATIENSQHTFYALNLNKQKHLMKGGEKGNLTAYSLAAAEEDGALTWCGSVISKDDDIIRDSLQYKGTRVVTFAPILKWNMFPLAEIIKEILEVGKQGFGCQVEIEFAVNLYHDKTKKPEFCLLQIKPMVIGIPEAETEYETIQEDAIICRSSITLGNGTFDNLTNIIWVDPQKFDPSKTEVIAQEIREFNNSISRKHPYILIGPGRWGSADPWLGIPVNWQDIRSAKVIVEVGMKGLPIDPSFGSHFFQNVTSMRIGYFTIDHKNKKDTINHSWIKDQTIVEKKKYTLWVKTNDPVRVHINGQTGDGLILVPSELEIDPMDEEESTGI